MHGRQTFAALTLLAASLALAAPAFAQIGDLSANKCLAKKLKKVGASAGGRTKCTAKALKKDTSPAACLLGQTSRFTGGETPERGAFAKLESKGDCLTTGDAGTLEARMAALVDELTGVVGASARSQCDSRKLSCAQKYLIGRTACYAKAAKRSGPADPTCLEKQGTKLTSCVSKATTKADCTSEATGEAAAVVVDNFLTLSVCTLDGSACAVPDSLDAFVPEGFLRLEGVSRTAFNPVGTTLDFRLIGTEFGTLADAFSVTVNGIPIDSSQIVLGPTSIQVTGALEDGRNEIAFAGMDMAGRNLYLTETIWAGSASLTVNLVNENGSSFNGATTVRAALVDDESVAAEGVATGGSIVFENVPFRTILARAEAKGNALGIAGFVGSAGAVEITMISFGNPSSVDNNDFSLGTDGWEIGDAPVTIEPHDEGTAVPLSIPRGGGPIPDNDLILATAGVEGERSIRRTFVTKPDTTAVRIRYRFITSEVPGGFYGSEFNDYYRVSLRSVKGKGVISDSNGMNGFPESIFDAVGAIPWREVVLKPIGQGGDTVQVDLGVANVGDGAYDSILQVDFVGEQGDQVIPRIVWNTTNGGLDLTFQVQNGALLVDTNVEIYFASGPAYANKLGTPVFTHPIPAGKAEGNHGTVRIPGNLLAGDPPGTSHLLAVATPTSVAPLADVTLDFGVHANEADASTEIRDVIKDGLRASGQARGYISSTSRSPADQARAMFQNLTNPTARYDGDGNLISDGTIQGNIDAQNDVYAAPGEAVIDIYEAFVATLPIGSENYDAINANQGVLRQQMTDKIIELGPSTVSRHCADPAVVSTVDLSVNPFNATNVSLYPPAVASRLTDFIDERSVNNCYHHSLNR